MRFDDLPESEVRNIAAQKKRNGCATTEALKAQEHLRNKANMFAEDIFDKKLQKIIDSIQEDHLM